MTSTFATAALSGFLGGILGSLVQVVIAFLRERTEDKRHVHRIQEEVISKSCGLLTDITDSLRACFDPSQEDQQDYWNQKFSDSHNAFMDYVPRNVIWIPGDIYDSLRELAQDAGSLKRRVDKEEYFGTNLSQEEYDEARKECFDEADSIRASEAAFLWVKVQKYLRIPH